jgi:hypothetical protein
MPAVGFASSAGAHCISRAVGKLYRSEVDGSFECGYVIVVEQLMLVALRLHTIGGNLVTGRRSILNENFCLGCWSINGLHFGSG